jgi:hypothetical protein
MLNIVAIVAIVLNSISSSLAQSELKQNLDSGYRSRYDQQGYNNYDPNKLLNGFFPIWSFYLLGLAGRF